ncbi:hypothetical protein QVD17_18631 [Tagetes erecta]|uniref:Uncharacterized protein n=1 Tax=Tagetes erecta TaxID=13708 RepID=A0AAD8NVX6_TARER|nr:hypothetical protein QVD17_18631 [Tagetes erecta]
MVKLRGSSSDVDDHIKKLSKKIPINSACEKYTPSALTDAFFLMTVFGACGFLIHPFVSLLLSQVLMVFQHDMYTLKRKVKVGQVVYGVLGLVVIIMCMVMLIFMLCKSRKKCGQPGCRGLKQAVEFDIQLETEDDIKNNAKNSSSVKYGVKKGLFGLPKDYHKELEAELKKLAPVNGRVLFLFRGRCGCPVVQVEVPGPKKNNRKIKK